MNNRPSIAVFSFDLPRTISSDRSVWVQATPGGTFVPSDGRQMTVPAWRIDAGIASRLIERFKTRKTPPVVDYEHQTLYKEQNGQPAPAAGWIRGMEWRDGAGLFVLIELTARAAGHVDAGEYQFFSPVFLYHPKTGDVLDLQMGALTNYPAIDGMEAVSLRAAASAVFGSDLTEEELSMNELLKLVGSAFGLPETATEAEACAALSAHLVAVRSALGVADNASGEAVLAACTNLKAQAARVDPAQYIPLPAFNEIKSQLAVLSAQVMERDVEAMDALIDAALADGRLIPAQETWARELAKQNRGALSAYLQTAEPLAALRGSQTKGQAPADEKTGLTTDELAVCSRMGLTPDQFKAVKED